MINRRPPRNPQDPPPPPGDEAVAVKRSRKPVLSLKGRAMGYLSRREYSRAELRRKLMPYADAEDPEALDRLLDTLEAERWLSNERFAESVVHRRSSRLGTSRIVGELKQHQVDPDTVSALAEQLRETELSRARAVWQRKFGEVATTPEARAKQMRFLASRGFSRTVISKIVRGADEFSDDD
ncbi:recombination regulator RecX [Pandoraea iniqua]|uniref:recombination regulator RecX n=1 Tax=Pandoraea iniqua TaxID=2508288 RepID=UPI0012412928|nr:recombination regulator RecX [Pandoraea iniqua]